MLFFTQYENEEFKFRNCLSIENLRHNFNMAKKLIILILLLFLIISPRLILGMRNERVAQEAVSHGDFAYAAKEYELAAHRLFWRGDLWNGVGKTKLISGQKAEALVAYEMAKKKGVLSAFGWDILGQENWNQGNHDKAFYTWKEGLLRYPDYFEFYSRLAMLYREEGDCLSERNALENRLRFESEMQETAPFHYRLGLLLLLDSPKEALDELNRAARADDEFAPVVETLRASINLALLESDPAESMILLGRGLALVGEWQLAAQMFEAATQDYPANASAWAWLGEAKQHLESGALPDLDKALNLNPNSVLVRSLRGLYWQRQGKLAEALLEFQVAVKTEPQNPNWHTAIGEIHALSGELTLALEAYQHATSLAPEDPFYWHLLALFSANYAVQLEDIGLPAAQKAVLLRPKDAIFADTLGWVYFGMAQDEKAEEQFLLALILDPDLGVAHLHLGMLYLKRNHLNLAYQSLLRARELSRGTLVEEQALRLLDEYFQEE